MKVTLASSQVVMIFALLMSALAPAAADPCVTITKTSELTDPNLLGKATTFCSFDLSGDACDVRGGNYFKINSPNKKTSFICQKGATCRFACGSAYKFLAVQGSWDAGACKKNKFDFIGNFVVENTADFFVQTSNSELNIVGATFKNIHGYPAIYPQTNSIVNVCNSTFENNSANGGAGINLGSGSKVSVVGCTFRNNKSRYWHGGINVGYGNNMLSIKDSVFDKSPIGFSRRSADNGIKSDICTGGTKITNSGCNTISQKDKTCVDQKDTCDYRQGNVVAGFDEWKAPQACQSDYCGADPTKTPTATPTKAPTKSPTKAPTANPTQSQETPRTTKGSSSGDPHFKTWTGEKFDYHGECDLVLVDHPSFADGLGLRLHIRTTRVKYFSFIEKVALQIGDDILEFDNDAENFLINGKKVGPRRKHHTTMLGGFPIRRGTNAISVRLHDEGSKSRQALSVAKIDFHPRKNGFPAVIVDGGNTDIFRGSLGLLGEWGTGLKMARDGKTEIAVDPEDASAFALEWQVRDTEPMLFKEVRFPQFPITCTPPASGPALRISEAMHKEAEKACDHWEHEMDDCIFDVLATRDVLVAEEGHIVHVE